jgi:GT2 family glycosyltransferase
MESLTKIGACTPQPAEILVHVDGGDTETANAIRHAFPDVVVLESEQRLGPGGGRNRLIAASKQPLIAGFDDDSHPLDRDFFRRVVSLFQCHPSAAVIGGAIFHRNEPIHDAKDLVGRAATFVGCGVIFRREAFLAAGGYVPRQVPYRMEEDDLALRLFDRGELILFSPWLRVFHDHDTVLAHHRSAEATAGTIANIALHAFLRYPPVHFPYGVAQVLNRIVWSIGAGRFSGIVTGIAGIPADLWRHRHLRAPVSSRSVTEIRRLRHVGVVDLEPLSSTITTPG